MESMVVVKNKRKSLQNKPKFSRRAKIIMSTITALFILGAAGLGIGLSAKAPTNSNGNNGSKPKTSMESNANTNSSPNISEYPVIEVPDEYEDLYGASAILQYQDTFETEYNNLCNYLKTSQKLKNQNGGHEGGGFGALTPPSYPPIDADREKEVVAIFEQFRKEFPSYDQIDYFTTDEDTKLRAARRLNEFLIFIYQQDEKEINAILFMVSPEEKQDWLNTLNDIKNCEKEANNNISTIDAIGLSHGNSYIKK